MRTTLIADNGRSQSRMRMEITLESWLCALTSLSRSRVMRSSPSERDTTWLTRRRSCFSTRRTVRVSERSNSRGEASNRQHARGQTKKNKSAQTNKNDCLLSVLIPVSVQGATIIAHVLLTETSSTPAIKRSTDTRRKPRIQTWNEMVQVWQEFSAYKAEKMHDQAAADLCTLTVSPSSAKEYGIMVEFARENNFSVTDIKEKPGAAGFKKYCEARQLTPPKNI